MRYSIDSLKNGLLIKAAQPIPNLEVIEFWDSLDISFQEAVFDYDVIPEFKEKYSKWIQTSKRNSLIGLNQFGHTSLTSGTSESFHIFWAKHARRRLRFFRGEFILHKLISRNNNLDYEFLEDDVIRSGDAVVVSLPYSDFGCEHPQMSTILDACDELGVPVLVDCAYMVIAKDIVFNFDRECIELVTFSLSKGFWGVDKLRCGMRFQKVNDDDGIDVSNGWGTLNLLSLSIAHNLISRFGPDYNWDTFEQRYLNVVREYELQSTNCILFALGDDRYQDFNRGGDVNRVCVSNAIGNVNVE